MVITNNPTNSASGAGAASASSSATGASNTSDLASEQTFLKLFVAQLQNQDPLNPNQQDPTQMVSELAQFSELEQLVNIGQDVHTIDQSVVAAGAASPGATGTSAGSGSAAAAQKS